MNRLAIAVAALAAAFHAAQGAIWPLQAEIDRIAAGGGGTLVVTAGVHRTGALFFKPGVNLHLERGAVIEGVDDEAAYPMVETRIEGQTRRYFPALVNADRCHGFTITGEGTIDGHGLATWKEFWRLLKEKGDILNCEPGLVRPRVLYVSNSRDVEVSGVTFKNSKFWTTHYYRCRDLRIHDCTILSEPAGKVRGPSTDAIDIDFCRNVTISNVVMNVNDDAIAIKGGKGAFAADRSRHPENGPSANILIADCTFGNWCHSAVTVGSECVGVSNLTVRACRINGPANLLHLKIRPDTPQLYSDILVEGCTGHCRSFLAIKPWSQFADTEGRDAADLMSRIERVTMRGNTIDCKVEKFVKWDRKVFEISDLHLERNTINGDFKEK